MPAAATADEGFRSTARLIASWNVMRSAGGGACAASEATKASAMIAALKRCATNGRLWRSPLGLRNPGSRLRRGFVIAPPPPDAFHHDVQDGNKGQIQKGRRDHAPGYRGADRVPRLAAGAAREHERHHAE